MNRSRLACALAAAASALPLLAAVSTPSAADARVQSGDSGLVAYRAARVHRSGADFVEDGCLVVADGKVVGVMPFAAAPALARVVDLGAVTIFPGLVAADATLTGTGGQGDLSLGAHRRAVDAHDPFLDATKFLERGITTAYLSPDRNRLIGGRGAVVKLAGAARVLAAESDLRVDLTPDAWFPPDYFRPPIPPTSENPLLPAIAQPPTSRAGALLALRSAREDARLMAPGADPNADGLRAWLAGAAPMRAVVRSTDDALAALELAAEWKRAVVLDGLERVDAARLRAEASSAPAALLFAVPLFATAPELGAEWEAPRPGTLQELAQIAPLALRAGPYGRWTWLLEAASAAVGYGLDEALAMDAITRVPARVLGVEGRVGALDAGCDADFLALSGPPLDPATRVLEVWVNGESAWSAAVLDAPQRRAGTASDAPPVVVRAGTLWTGDGPPLTGGAEVLLQDGRILAAGRSVPHPPGARLVDAGDSAHLTPGFVDARSMFGADRAGDARLDLARLAAGSRYSDAWLPIARAGVTTLAVGPGGLPPSGGRASFLKTAAASSSDAALADRFVVLFDLRTRDHAAGAEGLKSQLQRGKAYADKWVKYREERAKWEGEQGKKQAEERVASEKELRKRLAAGQAAAGAKKEEAGDKQEQAAPEEEKKVVDPLNGLWSATITHQMLPEPIEVQMRLHHEGAKLSGVFSSPEAAGEELELEGTWDEASKTIRFELPTEMGNAVLTGTITAPDVLQMRAELQGFGAVDFTANRIEVEESGSVVTRKRTKTDDGPQPPPTDWGMEGMRALFEKRAVAVVYADRRDEIGHAIEALRAFELPVRIGGAAEAMQALDALRAAQAGIVLGPEVQRREDNRDVVPAALLLAQGLPVAFQSGSGAGARFLPDVVKMAVRHGLGADQALHALTAGAADLLGVADRVGRVRAGLDGDLVVHSGPPFDLRSRVLHVFVNGREVPQE